MPEDENFIDVASPSFLAICEALDQLTVTPNATWAFDGMSGGFKYPDEVPLTFVKANEPLKDQVVTILRVLWGYRVAMVRGEPRDDLQVHWQATAALAPSWPGFLLERCSAASAEIATECLRRADELLKGLDELDTRCNARPLDSVAS